MSRKGKIYVVEIGPGNKDNMTFRAYKVIEDADVIIGHKTYIACSRKFFQIKKW